jgi:death-on-curing family protein
MGYIDKDGNSISLFSKYADSGYKNTSYNFNLYNVYVVLSVENTIIGVCSSYERACTIFDKSSILFYTLCNNHGFHDGNKRTAVIVTFTFLELNDFKIRLNDDSLYNLSISIDKGSISKNSLTKLFKNAIIKN